MAKRVLPHADLVIFDSGPGRPATMTVAVLTADGQTIHAVQVRGSARNIKPTREILRSMPALVDDEGNERRPWLDASEAVV
jgi:cell wall-associated NlpC family hydrolase